MPASEPPQANPAHANAQTPVIPKFHIDRTLAIPVGVQLRGQIEYGIAGGEILRGSRLPSVRELAQDLGVAHMTVVQVYKDLLALGLIVTYPGRGTFVTDAPRTDNADLGPLRRLLESTVRQAEAAGYTLRQVSDVLAVLASRAGGAPRPGVEVVLVGLFLDATSAYARTLQDALPSGDAVHALTLEDLRTEAGRSRAAGADVVLALAHRLAETRALLPGTPIIPVNFIPSDTTRQALAVLNPMIRLAVIATFEEFLPTFLAGVKRFAPHVTEIRATHVHAPDLHALLQWCDEAVYATGSELVGSLTRKPTFEYRHTIDPRDIEQLVLPAVQARHLPLPPDPGA